MLLINNIFYKRKNLVSLDLSFNQITDLVQLIDELSKLEKLKILNMFGNPISVIHSKFVTIKCSKIHFLLLINKAFTGL
jgi:Leucine-rich repeat (LRR) protein